MRSGICEDTFRTDIWKQTAHLKYITMAGKRNEMTIYILGSAGWIPGTNETSCIMVENRGELFILDAGTGMSNLRKYRGVLDRYDTVHLLLSHYHLDHMIGLIYIDPFIREKRFRVYGPGRMAYPETTEYYLHAFLRKEFFSRSIDTFSDDVRIMDFPAESFFIGDTKITVTEQKHSAPSFRITLDERLIYATDTVFQADAWSGISADVLFHECWEYAQSGHDRHTSLLQLENQLPLDRFGRVFLIHHNPDWSGDDYRKIREMISGTNIFLAEDGMEIRI